MCGATAAAAALARKRRRLNLYVLIFSPVLTGSREVLIKSHMRNRSAFVPCTPVRSIGRHSTKAVHSSIGTKALRSLLRDEIYWVTSGPASATLRALPRYLPWLRRDA